MNTLGVVPWDPQIHVDISGSGWQPAALLVTLLAVLVALFKDEFWHWRHAPSLDVALVEAPYPSTEFALHLRNPSKRLSAEGVSVRALELEPHPLEYTIGPKWSNHIIQVDRLVPRVSGETTFHVAPEAEVSLPLFSVGGAWTEEEPAVATIPWWDGPTTNTGDHDGLLVLPSFEVRETYIDPYPDLRHLESCPAMIRLEVSGNNVRARLYTVKITRDVDAWPGEDLPGNPAFHRSTFSASLEAGLSDHNDAPHGGQAPRSEDVPKRDKPWAVLRELKEAELAKGRQRREQAGDSKGAGRVPNRVPEEGDSTAPERNSEHPPAPETPPGDRSG